MRVKDLAEKPREKAIQYGVDQLTDTELLALLIESGTKQHSAFELSQMVLADFEGINNLKYANFNSLTKHPGIKEARAIRILCAIELASRISFFPLEEKLNLNSAQSVYTYLAPKLSKRQQEYFYALYLDTKHNLIREKTLFIGVLNGSLVHPREVLKEALEIGAACMIIAHNHPSGAAEPSDDDVEITKWLYKSAQLMGIPILDHIIIGNREYFSFKEAGIIDI